MAIPKEFKTVGHEQVELLQSIDAHLASLKTIVGEKLTDELSKLRAELHEATREFQRFNLAKKMSE